VGIAELISVASTTIKALRGSPGKTVNVTATGIGGTSIEAEYYQTGGVFHRPAKKMRGIFIPIGPSRRYGVILGGTQYQINITVDEGGTVIYATDATGSIVKASITLDVAGKIEIKNEAQNLKTVLDGIIDHLSALTTIPCVNGSPVTLAPSVISQLTADKAALAALLK
jgi:hypothetical protein